MLTRILKAAFSIAIVSSILFSGWASANAAIKGYTPPIEESLSSPSNKENVVQDHIEQTNIDYFLGDEQIFPFEPGLGGNKGGITNGMISEDTTN